jgi:hypothetical protein
MADVVKLAEVTASTFSDADTVFAVDPNVPDYYKQVGSQMSADDLTRAGTAAQSLPKAIEVELDSEDPEQYQHLKSLVEAAKEPQMESMWELKK